MGIRFESGTTAITVFLTKSTVFFALFMGFFCVFKLLADAVPSDKSEYLPYSGFALW